MQPQDHTEIQSRQEPSFLNPQEYTLIQSLLDPILRRSNLSLARIEPLSLSLYPVYVARLSNGSNLLVKFGPAPSARLLRLEKRGLENEILALRAIISQSTLAVPRISGPDEMLTISPTFPMPLSSLTHTILTCPSGTPLPSLFPPGMSRCQIPTPGMLIQGLSPTFLATLYRTLGAAFRELVQVHPEDPGIWGSIPSRRGSATTLAAKGPSGSDGAGSNTSWQAAFLSMMEASLRDAEDMLVSIPYDAIRVQIAQHSSSLESFREPSALVPLDVLDAANVMVDERTGEVVGLSGLGPCVWGDIRVGHWVAEWENLTEFWEGFGTLPKNERDGKEGVRYLLYTVYRSLTAINRHYYRPDEGGDELDPRRTLTWALNQLAALT
ncbi:hypothetical protein P152DRAFT_517526 [Eremomyces bilateralis CBS 781.70]|uniref:Aminoglycoside phosphotransferase domain-containing protein n=1 Tax=Eremomyces bilateralis CBS 781.70 TaxID=1392243 RepID=A0A6G1FS05_9PEZI|nr:uncharacterized protein P152DRAFT_517526 [Eremomyces bilateralis CBS 781.70]KAF1808508.1 hypothetical protein P152DRAFT_517526 [Eremomyces bilateralis CBS 781.70]